MTIEGRMKTEQDKKWWSKPTSVSMPNGAWALISVYLVAKVLFDIVIVASVIIAGD